MTTKRDEKLNINDNKRISRRNTEKSSEAEKRIRLSDDNVEVNKKTIEKLLRTNSQIISKLEVLITGQKSSKSVSWLVQQHRSIRETFTSRVKRLGINYCLLTLRLVRQKFRNGKLRKENKNSSKTQIMYAISICEMYLNPNNQNIQMSESIMKLKIINNLQKLENRDKFTHSDDDSHDGIMVNDVDNGGDGAGAAVTNDGKLNDGATNDNNDAGDKGILSSDSYNTEEEGRYVNSLLENYRLYRK
ncbi:unnamed protein product [Rhizophagus irregularis]|nr:unnamed protein product [Rhizophagus irregularis]